jgi:LAS superfamily LD-carboxypeptidase LdcB
MFAAAARSGITLRLGSAYRSEALQNQLYWGYVAQYGQATADTISSRPGYSDHQTGLAADISDHDGATYLTQAMEYTPEGIWLRDHAHEYGFIMRYPEGKEAVTGYAYQPWHYRYIGKDVAKAIHEAGENYTLEEYYKIK